MILAGLHVCGSETDEWPASSAADAGVLAAAGTSGSSLRVVFMSISFK